MIYMENVTASNFGGDAFSINGGGVVGNNVRVKDGGGNGFNLDNGAFAALSNSKTINLDGAGIRARDSDILLNNYQSVRNDIGLDFGDGVRGDIFNSEISDNRTADIRYSRDVLVGVFNTAAKELRKIAWSTVDIDRVDAEWITSRILDTTDAKAKAMLLKKWTKRFGTFAFSNVLWMTILWAIKNL